MKKNKIYRILLVIIINLIFFYIHFFLGNVVYNDGDDETFNLITVGAYGGDNSKYLIFSNICYGYILKTLCNIIPNINMYLVFIVFFNFICIFYISYIFSERLLSIFRYNCNSDSKIISKITRNDFMIPVIFTILVNFTLDSDFYNNLQFTKNAGLYTLTGIVLLFVWVKNKSKLNNIIWILGCFLIILGFWVRKESFILIVGLSCLIFIIWTLINHFDKIIKLLFRNSISLPKIIKENLRIIFVIFIILFFISISYILDKKAYSSQEWKEYKEYNIYRSFLLDYELPLYEEHVEEYNKLGLDENDVEVLKNWIHIDTKQFDLDTLKAIVNMIDSEKFELRINNEIISKVFWYLKSVVQKSYLPIIWIIILIYLINKKSCRLLLTYIFSNIIIVMVYWYLLCKGRMPLRVELIIWLTMVVFFILLLLYDRGKGKEIVRKFEPLYLIMILIIGISILFIEFEYYYYDYCYTYDKNYFYEYTNYSNVYDKIKKKNKNLYIVTTLSSNKTTVRNIVNIDKSYKDYFSNIIFAGGWTSPSPLIERTLEKYNIDNPLMSLVEDNIYLVDKTRISGKIKIYLEKRLNKKIKVKEVDRIDDFVIYKYTID